MIYPYAHRRDQRKYRPAVSEREVEEESAELFDHSLCQRRGGAGVLAGEQVAVGHHVGLKRSGLGVVCVQLRDQTVLQEPLGAVGQAVGSFLAVGQAGVAVSEER